MQQTRSPRSHDDNACAAHARKASAFFKREVERYADVIRTAKIAVE